MFELFGIPPQALFGQLLLGLINGSFYALLSLGLAVIFGLLNIINFTHGAQYMMGAFVAWMLLTYLGIGYWWALLLAPLIVGAIGIVHRAAADLAALPARPSLRPAADLRPGADHPGPVPQPVRRLGPALRDPAGAARAARISASCSCRTIAAWVVVASLVVCLATWFADREDQARRLSARRDREPDPGPGLRHQRAAPGHADLRLRRRARGASPACWPRRSIRSTRTWAPTSSSSSSPSS